MPTCGNALGRPRLIVTTVVVASCIVASGCDGGIRVRGQVVDTAGAPISTARIHLEPARNGRRFDDGTTSDDGCFSIGHVVAPGRYNYLVRITAPGFKPVEGVIAWPKNEAAVQCETSNGRK
jgi:hypothetical protein